MKCTDKVCHSKFDADGRRRSISVNIWAVMWALPFTVNFFAMLKSISEGRDMVWVPAVAAAYSAFMVVHNVLKNADEE